MATFGSGKIIMDRTFPCLTCQATIRLQRKDDNSGWNRYNLDGTPHVDPKKNRQRHQQQQQEQPTQPEQKDQQPTQQQQPTALQVQQHPNLAKEVSAIKAYLQAATVKLESLEKELVQQKQ